METPGRIEPCLFDDGIPQSLADLALTLQAEALKLGGGLPPAAAAELADMVRVMNCYYSNLIEGHNTRPKDIESALLSNLPETRPLVQEALAHIAVQREIDGAAEAGRLPSPTSVDYVQWLHRAFYDRMPDLYRFAEEGDRRIEIVPGQFRHLEQHDVTVGRHQPPSSNRVTAFMDHFAWRYKAAETSPAQRIIAIASAHHRLNYIHPFVDGNGRVSRLMSHAMAQKAGVGGGGLWSISRGLARGLKDRGEYMQMMNLADTPRQGDRDGRGNLSLSALTTFCEWFLSLALDQVRFMARLFEIEGLEGRYRQLVRDLDIDKRAPEVVSWVLRHGQLERSDAALALKTSERTARNTISAMIESGILRSETQKRPLRVAFPLDFRERLFPNLFGE